MIDTVSCKLAGLLVPGISGTLMCLILILFSGADWPEKS